MATNLSKADIERVALWAKGYRQLMRGGLDREIHTAHTEVSKLPVTGEQDVFAWLAIDDIEGLLAIAERAYEMAMTGDPTANWISHD